MAESLIKYAIIFTHTRAHAHDNNFLQYTFLLFSMFHSCPPPSQYSRPCEKTTKWLKTLPRTWNKNNIFQEHAFQCDNIINHIYNLRLSLPGSYMLMFTMLAAGGAGRAALLVNPATFVTAITLLLCIF